MYLLVSLEISSLHSGPGLGTDLRDDGEPAAQRLRVRIPPPAVLPGTRGVSCTASPWRRIETVPWAPENGSGAPIAARARRLECDRPSVDAVNPDTAGGGLDLRDEGWISD